ncbi:penicillin-insensitive murein endopeptidase [Niastella vici]|uniref:penicillin-insensitive murein endopeptidase n=1 Tax=Niastella vici TaxID=1703345 RepID=UPI001C1F9E89|nr:penicillin-insensitive murein endopeptidase [Niastella vici]
MRKDLRNVAYSVASEMNKKYPGTVINYLDANFPFVNGFPLFPHLSHNDGKKMDLAFCYKDKQSLQETNATPSPIGYGICEEPTAAEKNTTDFCVQQGYWQYSLLKSLMPQGRKKDFVFYPEKTRSLVELFAHDNRIGKIFIEPHLKLRLQLTSDKIRFHGCQAVRHDDHIHVQLK